MDAKALEQAEELAELTEQQIYDRAYRELTKSAFDLGDEESRRRRVERWIGENKKELQSRICGPMRKFIEGEDGTRREKVLLIAAIADVLAGASIGIAPLTAAALLLTYGIKRLCDTAPAVSRAE
ncbi:hypothetical protein [Tropicimonas sp. IMCC34043]|uniref:hypothetical protein n=1 Tax=Tropicimonas sp. IMCC34043 TaxID=2248760 RepID=UPI001300B78F|nr:hypothetical protein [Tropicimonas sp. IMCC34043]